jgi:acetyl-CoA carboxylase biotin carboxyl carrier protein
VAQHDGANDAPKTERSPEERRADHAAIDRLAEELLPALVAKLGASGLGELDVREGAWRIRLRMPADGRASRRTGGSSRGGHQPPSPHAAPAHAAPSTRSSSSAASPESDPGPPTRAVATSPAVGFYRPRPDRAAGARVRAGDPLGAIDVLGVPQELTSPADGIVGASLVEPGDPVEYGQEVVEIELLGAPPTSPAAPATAATRPEAG